MTKILTFDQSQRHCWDRLTNELNRTVFDSKKQFKKSFEIEIRELRKPKSYEQLKGFHRLINILLPHFREWTGEYWDLEKGKEFIKKRYGYTMKFKGVEVVKSLRDANIEDMIGLIKEAEKFGAEMGIEGCFLKSSEKLELEKFYNIV